MDALVRDARMRLQKRITTLAMGGEATVSQGGSWFTRASEPEWILHRTRMAKKIVTAARASLAAGVNLDYDEENERDYVREGDSVFWGQPTSMSSVMTQSSRLLGQKRSLATMRSGRSTQRLDKEVVTSSSSEKVSEEEEDEGPVYRIESVFNVEETEFIPEKVQFAETRASATKRAGSALLKEPPQDDFKIRPPRHVQQDDEGLDGISRDVDIDSDDELDLGEEVLYSDSFGRISIQQQVSSMRSLAHSSVVSRQSSSKMLSGTVVPFDEYVDVLYQEQPEEESSELSLRYSEPPLREISMNAEVCNSLGVLPELSEISEDVSDIIVPHKGKRLSKRDSGRFVNPLTGELTSSSISVDLPETTRPSKKSLLRKRSTVSKKSIISRKSGDKKRVDFSEGDEEALELIEEEVEEEDERDYEDDELLALVELNDGIEELEKQELLQQPQPVEEHIDMFLEADLEKKVVLDDGTNFEMIAAELTRLKVIQQTQEFLDRLIIAVVEICENADPMKDLDVKLDKFKLIDEIESMVSQLEIEQRTRYFLNRKTVDYFRRKKIFRSILEDNPEHLAQNMERYREMVSKLDELMGREEELKAATDTKIEQLQSDYMTKHESTEEKITEFNELVQNTLVRESSKDPEKMLGIVKNLLSIMEKLRTEISRVRFTLIQKQHDQSTMLEKLEKLENIGEGLRMADYEHLQTDTLALGKKIEERNSELSKWRTHCEIDYHLIAHMRERQQMLRGNIATQKEAFEELMLEKQACRARVHAAKLDRGKVRREMRELSFQGGLIDKPTLMMDYDKTAAAVDNLHQVNAKMKARYRYLLERIAIAEKCLLD